MSIHRLATLALAAGAAALVGSTLATPPAQAATTKLWGTRSTVYAQAVNLPPGLKGCWLRVPPAPYDIIGTYLGSQKGRSAERNTRASAITLSVGGLSPAPYKVYFECRMAGSLNLVARAQKTVRVGM